MSVYKGLALVYSRSSPIHLLPDDFKWISDAYLGRIPIPALLMLVVYVLCWALLTYTTLGRHIYAIGGNEPATRLIGLAIGQVKLYVYSICGFLSALAGIILTARLDGGIYTNGEGYELNAIAGVVMGGTSLMGGRGNIWGTVIGVLIMTTVNNALVMYNIPAEWKNVVSGGIIIVAVLVDMLRKQVKD